MMHLLLINFKLLNIFLPFFSPKVAIEVGKEVTFAKVEMVLKGFAKERGPGIDGWTFEFFLEVFYLVGLDLLATIEQSQTEGHVS